MRRTIISLAGLLGAAGAAHADSRFFCSTDDSSARFTIESGFQDEAGHRLNHFRGALIVKNESVPEVFRKRVFDSSKLTNRWSHDGELRLEIFDDGSEDAKDQSLSLVILAEGRGKTFSGTYGLMVSGDGKPFTASGKVSCGSK
ncbi:hypothetical protein AM571_CH00871 [Rhizobium etli 8C-3]|uniref:Uncharacterized protein n=2 Tax=Rhizobium TaxID=379 RepID=A0A4R3R4N0_9HYPH|nr:MULTISPECIES: hypothetical protein [Rhizobium]APO73714.1 hypothetical protein AM571_CH00871 [Rhizobium etli 8C-3]TCU27942.1 hypothetical protein EV130_103347 [Rhizobium azibense]TCU37272.1 hypothetical protein EV129_106235 [Rhizobium azibense]